MKQPFKYFPLNTIQFLNLKIHKITQKSLEVFLNTKLRSPSHQINDLKNVSKFSHISNSFKIGEGDKKTDL